MSCTDTQETRVHQRLWSTLCTNLPGLVSGTAGAETVVTQETHVQQRLWSTLFTNLPGLVSGQVWHSWCRDYSHTGNTCTYIRGYGVHCAQIYLALGMAQLVQRL
jgi:hypothetical protein